MMTAMTKFVMSAVFGLTMFAAGDAGAARDDGPRHEARGDKMCAKLGCTDAQKAQLAQIREGMKDKIKPEREAIRGLKQQIAAEYRKDKLDSTRLRDLYAQLDARKGTIEGYRRAMRAQVHAVLTPDQRAAAAERMERRAERGHGKGKGHGKHGKGRGKGHGKGRGKGGATQGV